MSARGRSSSPKNRGSGENNVLARSFSPTRVIWDTRAKAQRMMTKMQKAGLHIYDPSWAGYHSGNFTEVHLSIFGTKETMVMPVQVCTRVRDVKAAVAHKAMVHPETLTFVIKQGCTYKKQEDCQEIGRAVTIRGIKSFDPQPHEWPHPHCFMGAGYNAIKHCIYHIQAGGMKDYVMFDRYDRFGGQAWIVQANKTSRLQTELAAFHVWFGCPWDDTNELLGYPTEWETWPKQDQVIAHMNHAAERYGLPSHTRFHSNVCNMEILGKLTDFDRVYLMTIQPEGKTNSDDFLTHKANALFHFPGAYHHARIIDYPGENTFDGKIGYGMNDDLPYDHVGGSIVAILGNGAFAVENIRTCMEYGAKKVWLVTRRKNLPSPRLCCWFVHQAIVPVPAAMLLNTFIPMFEKCGFGDPWSYHSVYATKDKSKATIMSNSRFGIGDVTFLAVAWGRVEYVVDLCKRMSRHTVHLEGGQKLENVTVVVKALGLIADFGADRLHKVKEFVGPWPNGDYRRTIFVDPLGMNAANFTTFSAGIGGYVEAIKSKFLLDFPQEYKKLVDEGMIDMLPRSKATDAKPAHQYDAKYLTSVSMVIEGCLPRLTEKYLGMDDYMSRMYWVVNPLDKFFDECTYSWDAYQEDWWKMGFDHPYVPYPYTKEMIYEWQALYKQTVGPLTVEEKQAWMDAQEAALNSDDHVAQWDHDGSKYWWMATNDDMKDWLAKRSGFGGGGG